MNNQTNFISFVIENKKFKYCLTLFLLVFLQLSIVAQNDSTNLNDKIFRTINEINENVNLQLNDEVYSVFNPYPDYLMLLDGNHIKCKILLYDVDSFIHLLTWDEKHNLYFYTDKIAKAKVQYFNKDNEKIILNDISPEVNDYLIWKSLNAYSERSKTGYVLMSIGIGSLIASNIIAEMQAKAITNNPATDINYNIPKNLNYLGLGLMLTGSIVKITSYKLLKKDVTVSVGINSVSVNF